MCDSLLVSIVLNVKSSPLWLIDRPRENSVSELSMTKTARLVDYSPGDQMIQPVGQTVSLVILYFMIGVEGLIVSVQLQFEVFLLMMKFKKNARSLGQTASSPSLSELIANLSMLSLHL